jgi:hypothetical protein
MSVITGHRAWSEDVIGGVGVCIHVIVLNTANSFQVINAAITFAGLADANVSAFLPFEDDGERIVIVQSGALQDTIAPYSVNVYRIGCQIPPPDAKNLSPNGDFEMFGLLGGVTGWSGGRAGWYSSDGHDLRARMFLDTTRPQHGRYALRVTVPTVTPLTTGWSQACIDSYYPKVHKEAECNAGSDGTQLVKGTRFTITLWARSDGPDMQVSVLSGAWLVNATELLDFHMVGSYVRNETFVTATVNGTWQRLSARVAASAEDRFLQLQFSGGPGSVFIDNTGIWANLTSAEERAALQTV